jgi:hypothetical protein
MARFVQPFAFINQIGSMLHLDIAGKQPQLAVANLVIIEMSAGDLHVKKN